MDRIVNSTLGLTSGSDPDSLHGRKASIKIRGYNLKAIHNILESLLQTYIQPEVSESGSCITTHHPLGVDRPPRKFRHSRCAVDDAAQ